jgi:hypothetical protein
MKQRLILITILILVFLTNVFAQTNWLTFKSTDENFVISLPSEPKQERTNMRGPFGNGHHIYSVENNSISYTVSYSAFDAPPTNPKDIKRILDTARNLVLTVTNGKLLSDKEIAVDKFPGREVKIQKDKKIWTLRAYIVRERMYQLMTTEPKTKDGSAETAKFFDSFKLIDAPE